nr:ABC transporter permease [Okeania sp. SIO2B9]
MKGIVRETSRVSRWLTVVNTYWLVNLNLLLTLVRRDLEARYKGSILGNLWPLLNQLSQLLIYTYVFSIILKVKLNLEGLPEDSKVTFGLWLFAGLIPWLAFTNEFSPTPSFPYSPAQDIDR